MSGRVDWESLKDLVGRLLGDWKPGATQSIEEQPAVGRYKHFPYESNQTQIGIAYSSIPYRHPDYFQAWGAVGVLSGGMSARLVYRSPRAPRLVLQRLRLRTIPCGISAAFSAMPEPVPTGRKRP